MSLIKYGIAVAVGYHLGQPHGRRLLGQLRQQIVRLGTGPEAKRLRERGWDLAGDGALAAKNLVSSRAAGRRKTADPLETPAAPPSVATVLNEPGAGFGGRTMAEDSDAVITGVFAPPPVGRTPPPSPSAQP